MVPPYVQSGRKSKKSPKAAANEARRVTFAAAAPPGQRACAVCGSKRSPDKLLRHPFLDVLTCGVCNSDLCTIMFVVEAEGNEDRCKWTGNPSGKGDELYCCDHCPSCISQSVVAVRLGLKAKKAIDANDDFVCMACDPKPLAKLTAKLDEVLNFRRNPPKGWKDYISPLRPRDLVSSTQHRGVSQLTKLGDFRPAISPLSAIEYNRHRKIGKTLGFKVGKAISVQWDASGTIAKGTIAEVEDHRIMVEYNDPEKIGEYLLNGDKRLQEPQPSRRSSLDPHPSAKAPVAKKARSAPEGPKQKGKRKGVKQKGRRIPDEPKARREGHRSPRAVYSSKEPATAKSRHSPKKHGKRSPEKRSPEKRSPGKRKSDEDKFIEISSRGRSAPWADVSVTERDKSKRLKLLPATHARQAKRPVAKESEEEAQRDPLAKVKVAPLIPFLMGAAAKCRNLQ